MSESVRVMSTIPAVEIERLTAYATANDRTLSREIRRAVHFYLREHVDVAEAPLRKEAPA